ncbi:hypothetical protein RND71_003298 [Anisodus tanguticus]|uniref:Uncharacterized protein n=1 Tax=Anisodus tanguticus TaxID=243964 RepID=A0AAE1VPV0_9SOLA|nr:hypothetical protein RND71_003298 [Anisodus tanguticus]
MWWGEVDASLNQRAIRVLQLKEWIHLQFTKVAYPGTWVLGGGTWEPDWVTGGMFSEKEKTSKAEGHGIALLGFCCIYCMSHLSASDARVKARTGLRVREKGKEKTPVSTLLPLLKGR